MTNKSVRWFFNVSKWNPSSSDILLASSCIQPDQKQRLNRFVFKRDMKYSLVGYLMSRKYVSEASKQSYNLVNFIRDDRDKPIVENNVAKVNFNISHHGNYTVCVGECGELMLGVDVMKFEYSGGKSLNEFFRIMNRQFSSDEWMNIKGAGGEREQIGMFCRHWALKESYVKALGVGITINLQEISFKINSKILSKENFISDTELYIKGDKINWKFQECLLDEDHCVSVAVNNSESSKSTVFREITFEELMKNCVPFSEVDQEFCDGYFKKLEKTV